MCERDDELLDRTLRALGGATPPTGMERRVLEHAELRAADPVTRGWRWNWFAWPVGTAVAAGLILVAMEHRAVKVTAPIAVTAQSGESVPQGLKPLSPQGIYGTAKAVPLTRQSSSQRASLQTTSLSASHVSREKLPTDVLAGAPTQEEMLLVQMSRSNDAAVRDSLDAEKREQDIADAKKQFEDFLNQDTESTGKTTGESL